VKVSVISTPAETQTNPKAVSKEEIPRVFTPSLIFLILSRQSTTKTEEDGGIQKAEDRKIKNGLLSSIIYRDAKTKVN